MNTMLLSIAGRLLEVQGDKELQLLQTIPGFSIFEVSQTSSQLSLGVVSFGTKTSVPSTIQSPYTFDFNGVDIHCQFGRVGERCYFTMNPLEGEPFMMSYHMGDHNIEATACLDPDMLRFALWFAFSLLAAPHLALPIHASTIVCRNSAVLFLGESGTGKSTHTRLWLQHIPDCYLLNDDSPILSVENNKVWASGSPWSGKTHCYYQRTVPLKAIVRLSQAPFNAIRPLSTLEAFTALQPSCPPALNHDTIYTDHVVNLISEVLLRVPLFKMQCLPDKEAALTSFNAIFAHE